MADNVTISAGAGTTIAADEVVDGTLGTVKVQYVKLMDGALDGTTKAGVGANGLKVDGSAVTQPVSGTVTANQGGSWTVQPGNTANTTAWLVTGTGGTFPATQSGTWNVGTVTTVSAVTAISNALPAGENHTGQVGGHIANPSANFTRPADTLAYASGDLVANSTTAGSVVPLSWTVARVAAGSAMVRRVRLIKSGTTVTSASFRLHLYSSSPTVTNGDNGAWLSARSGYLGSFDLDMSGSYGRVFSDAAEVVGIPAVGSEVSVSLASGQTIYGLLEARSGYVPASAETFTAELECFQN